MCIDRRDIYEENESERRKMGKRIYGNQFARWGILIPIRLCGVAESKPDCVSLNSINNRSPCFLLVLYSTLPFSTLRRSLTLLTAS